MRVLFVKSFHYTCLFPNQLMQKEFGEVGAGVVLGASILTYLSSGSHIFSACNGRCALKGLGLLDPLYAQLGEAKNNLLTAFQFISGVGDNELIYPVSLTETFSPLPSNTHHTLFLVSLQTRPKDFGIIPVSITRSHAELPSEHITLVRITWTRSCP